MSTHTGKAQDNKSQSVANSISKRQGGGESSAQFADGWPEVISQRKLQRMADDSPQAMHLKAIQEMVNNSPHAEASTVGSTIQRNGNGDKLSGAAREILGGTRDVRDEALGLSEQQIELVEAMVLQIRLLEQLERELAEIERLQEASLPPVLPLDSFIEFQPPFNQLAPQVSNGDLGGELAERMASFKGSRVTAGAAEELGRRLGQGLRPASQLSGVALSGDARVANVVSVNVIPPSSGVPGAAATRAEFATTNRAGGAIPIAIEQAGDQGSINEAIITQRAQDSALLVIDPVALPPEDLRRVQASSDAGGGETGLSGVPPGAIIAVLAPANMVVDRETVARYHVHFVGRTEGPIYYAGTRTEILIAYPDFRTALQQIFSQNPNKTLVTHTTRLGPPRPIVGE